MADSPTSTRPGSVMVLAAIIAVMAVFNIATGIWLMIASMNPEGFSAITDHMGNAVQMSGFLLFINGLISTVFGLMLVWLLRITLAGSATAGMLITFLAVLNLVFALFRLPYGWGVILLSIIALILVNRPAAKAWFSQLP
ncbi:MAG: hypothetical protein ACKOW5_01670 [Actinomycetales bacterium]